MARIVLDTYLNTAGDKLYIMRDMNSAAFEYDQESHRVFINGEWQQLPDFIECRFTGTQLLPGGFAIYGSLEGAMDSSNVNDE